MAETTELQLAHNKFLEFLSSRKRAHATILAYGKDIEQLAAFLSDLDRKSVNEVTRGDLEAFLLKLEKEGYTAKSISRKINSIKTFYRFLRADGATRQDPASDIAHPRYEIKPPRILSRVEYRALRDACRNDPRISAIVELFLQTGIRIGELANLKLVDVTDSELAVQAQEGHAARSVPLNRAAKGSLDRYLTVRPKVADTTLFVTKTGRPLLIRNIRTAIDRYFRIAGIAEAKVNDLRHTFIAHHLMSGTPLTVISKLVGHKRLSTTEKYLDLVKDKMQESVKLEEL